MERKSRIHKITQAGIKYQQIKAQAKAKLDEAKAEYQTTIAQAKKELADFKVKEYGKILINFNKKTGLVEKSK